ncbi:dihydrofolate reductase family protein [Limosilactobacillus sp. STM2_1]|uniref:Dihydrofolate reductase family protein n=1 Tax=Limosilactobacillus rudii TaxID=2759755 RepID=A0A7W3ULK2_9LACO|nr:dihydrofolate reductase family protein [Limosilactobacillus rudii]MBB1079196.1 dihydrofolate reductase family protein [Limosilactobacillus rudii]MBB1097285.1 dihydrofolate reductase family protein [Limosilactobacillus rudii]MCD7134394.1 dihydrofolate reductase family protein [Limosilactobacillus rudii]
MNKPYIICHMMISVDGRIDCGMTAQLAGEPEYYSALSALNAPTRISGRVTAETELTSGNKFIPQNNETIDKTDFAKNSSANQFNIVIDTKGTLRWNQEKDSTFPHLIITSEQVTKEYLDYLNQQNISWIACGKDHVDLAHAMEILKGEFGIDRLAIVGGGKINGGFLDAGLIDEISILIGAGADGRINQPTLFDGRPVTRKPVALKLKDVKGYNDGAVWLRYLTK